MERYSQIKAINVVLDKESLKEAVDNVYRRSDKNLELKKQEFVKLTAKIKEEAKVGKLEETVKLIDTNYCTTVPRFDFVNSGVFTLVIFDLTKEAKGYATSIDCEIKRDNNNLWYVEL